MELLRDADIDPAPLAGKRVAILGYGNQGRAQALNLHDSGDRRRRRPARRLGQRDRSRSGAGSRPRWSRTRSASADVVMMLAPDEIHAALYREIEPHLRDGAALGFSHGLSVRFGFVDAARRPRRLPGRAQRARAPRCARSTSEGKGMIALWAVAQDATGNAREHRPRLRPRDRLRRAPA